MRYDDGFKLFVGILFPEYVDSTMSASTFDKTLGILRKGEKKRPEGFAVGPKPAQFGYVYVPSWNQ